MNILETMDFCKEKQIKGVLVSVDQAKAFDSVSHSFMEKVYKFFGFGERIQRWLKSIGTGQFTCIILKPGELSSLFNLEKGHAQGDSPSPLLYNLTAQVLLFKIELDPRIKLVRLPTALPGPVIPQCPFLHESNRETVKCNCFNTVMTLLEYESLLALKEILTDFRKLSGLKTNYDKTSLVRMGDLGGEIEQNILDLGFKVEKEIKLLGFNITMDTNMAEKNYESVVTKINKTIRFWDRFYLSLPGKITVYKTLLIPQINYIATILTPPVETRNILSNMMEKFVTQGLSIAKNRLYANTTEGGLGLFDLETFIPTLQSTWVGRAFNCTNDNWKYDLLINADFNVHNMGKNVNSVNLGSTLKIISKSFSEFSEFFSRVNENYKKISILNNKLFQLPGHTFDRIFFMQMRPKRGTAASKESHGRN